jgi:hypothetical protein
VRLPTTTTIVVGAATPIGTTTTPHSSIGKRVRGINPTCLFLKTEFIAQHLREELERRDRLDTGDDGGHQRVVKFLIQAGENVGHELFITK